MDEAIEKKISFDRENVIGISSVVVVLIQNRVENSKSIFYLSRILFMRRKVVLSDGDEYRLHHLTLTTI